MRKKILITLGVLSLSMMLIWVGRPVRGEIDVEIEGEALDVFNTMLFEQYVPIGEAKKLLDEEITEGVYIDNFVGGYLNRLEQRAEGLNTTFRMFIQEIANATDGDIEKIKSMKTDDVILNALLIELNGKHFKLYGDNLEHAAIRVNYERIIAEYGSLLTVDSINRLKLLDYSSTHALYDYENGHVDFESLNKRHEFIEGMINQKDNANSLYLMSEAYDNYRLLLGIDDAGTNNTDGTVKESVIDGMTKVAESARDKGISEDLRAVIAEIKVDGSYSDRVIKIAVELLDARFAEYVSSMGAEIGR